MAIIPREEIRDIVATSVHCHWFWVFPEYPHRFNDLITDDAMERLPRYLNDRNPEKAIDKVEAAILAAFDRFKLVFIRAKAAR